jgi:hypothetical protein
MPGFLSFSSCATQLPSLQGGADGGVSEVQGQRLNYPPVLESLTNITFSIGLFYNKRKLPFAIACVVKNIILWLRKGG